MRFLSGNKLETITIDDIAQGLSHICRWGGQTKTWFSVAQHSIMVAERLKDFKINGLMHDCGEVVYQDLPTPVKFAEFREREKQVKKFIYDRFNVPEDPPIVKKMDTLVKDLEFDTLVIAEGDGWPPKKAKRCFLEAWDRIHTRNATQNQGNEG